MCVHALWCFSSVGLGDPMDCSPPGSSVHGIPQARILEWIATPSSRDLPNPGIEPTCLMFPVLAGWFFTTSATWEATILNNIYIYKEKREILELRDFPGGPVVKTTFQGRGCGFSPWSWGRILHAWRPKYQNRSNIVTNSIFVTINTLLLTLKISFKNILELK